MQPTTHSTITPAQATYLITRLLNDRKLTTTDITHYLNDLQHEITTITERLAILHAAAQPQPTPRTASNAPSPARQLPPNTPSRKRRTPSSTRTKRTPSHTTPSNIPVPPNTTRRARRHFSPAARAKQKLQGSYLGYMRQLPAHERPRFQAIKARNGFPAAITALKKHLGK